MSYEDVLVYLKDAYMKMVVNLKYGLKKYGLIIIVITKSSYGEKIVLDNAGEKGDVSEIVEKLAAHLETQV